MVESSQILYIKNVILTLCLLYGIKLAFEKLDSFFEVCFYQGEHCPFPAYFMQMFKVADETEARDNIEIDTENQVKAANDKHSIRFYFPFPTKQGLGILS